MNYGVPNFDGMFTKLLSLTSNSNYDFSRFTNSCCHNISELSK